MTKTPNLKQSTLLQLYARAAAPCRDYYGLTITNSCISINAWKITHGPHVMPKQKICLLEDVIQDKFLQEEIKNIFGGNVFDYIMDLGNKKRKLENLPTALFLNILKYLRANDVLKLMQTNKIFFELCNTELVWLMMFQKILNRSPSIEEKRMALEYGWREVLKKRMAYIRKVFNENKQQKKKQLADPTRNKKVVKAK
ncbi:uncharacterized protein LOC111691709 [Anoplophora glabripennis]|uniref:uncharacterized protein LOC111691709 n=1 Tax=Anoplophora glabripennis TaxID=217634 RepID=UPI000C787700|nr:uncharacterized protein LOC111691709 [Anoplophora glabripennis]